ncbi:hypothetical protein HYQ44_001060 [Verticillium longisporum]|nr:hypothetical protein HYQ44_001060 [Verticillium longisporum]
MDNIKVPQLNTITLRSRPLTTHAITISCDAELAVAADDSVHIMLPEFPTPEDDTRRGNRDVGADENKRIQYHTHRGQYMTIKRPDPRMNAKLFDAAGLRCPGNDMEEEPYFGVGSGLPTGWGSSLNQVSVMEWSPTGVGYNLRPVLSVLLTNGSVMIYGQEGSAVTDISVRKRSFDAWRVLWGISGVLPLPDRKAKDGSHLAGDKIKSFSWAHKIAPGRALIAYLNDRDQIVIVTVEFFENPKIKKGPTLAWRVEEAARFPNDSPHPKMSIMDPDFVPSGSAFSIKWSPWAVIGDKRVAVIARISRSYLGFRKVTIPADWIRGERTVVTVDETDLLGICTNLMTDAFVEWENGVWTDGDDKICRGVVASPFDAKPFQVILNSPAAPAQQQHSPTTCNTLYPEESPNEGNPATGIIIHPPNTMDRTPAPVFSLVRLVASATNDNWYQTTAPAPSDSALEDQVTVPQWASTIDDIISLSVPVAMATQNADSDSEVGGPESDSDDDFEMPTDAGEQVNPWRIRIWGLAASPGGGMHAAMVSQQSALGPEPKVKSKIFWGFKPRLAAVVEPASEGQDEPSGAAQMTTEGKMWEWMYGGGPPVRGAVGWEAEYRPKGDEALREQLRSVLEAQVCGFCKAGLRDAGRYTVCDNGHTFATCTASGLAILAPGISRACGVCGRRCLAARQIASIAETHGVEAVVDPSAVELCGGCGGKFIA